MPKSCDGSFTRVQLLRRAQGWSDGSLTTLASMA